MDAYDTTELSNALNDVTNKPDNTNTEAAALAREKGWAKPEQYDYAAYNAKPQPVQQPAEPEVTPSDLPGWAANAAKYEWNGDMGDIGPPNPELEQQLFHSDHLNRVGLKLGK